MRIVRDATIVGFKSQAEMLSGLLAVKDTEFLRNRFYPIILKNAGEKLTASAIKLMFSRAMWIAVENLAGGPGMVEHNQLRILQNQFIDAIIDNADNAELVKKALPI